MQDPTEDQAMQLDQESFVNTGFTCLANAEEVTRTSCDEIVSPPAV
jgi:hypothetical protein